MIKNATENALFTATMAPTNVRVMSKVNSQMKNGLKSNIRSGMP